MAELHRPDGSNEPGGSTRLDRSNPGPGGADPRQVAAALEALAPLGDAVRAGASLGALTTYRVGGPAAVLITARSEADLAVVADAAARTGLPVLVVGRGSNLLVADAGFGGLAVRLDSDGFGDIVIEGSAVRAGAATTLPALARRTVEAGLTGLEWAVGVPGSVGGGVRMNAGGHGSDVAHCLEWCRVVDLAGPSPAATRRLDLVQLDYRYRHSAIEPHHVVVEAGFHMASGDPVAGRATIREIVRWRLEHQPGGQNAGSVFTNPAGDPPGNSAGWLIDTAGLKGLRVGTAEVSSKHANFIQADPGGRSGDVLELIRQVRSGVRRRHGVELSPELRLVGFGSADLFPGEASVQKVEGSTGGRGL